MSPPNESTPNESPPNESPPNESPHNRSPTQAESQTRSTNISTSQVHRNAQDDIICAAFDRSFAIWYAQSWWPGSGALTPTERARVVEGMRLLHGWTEVLVDDRLESRKQMENDLTLCQWLFLWEAYTWFPTSYEKQDRKAVWAASRLEPSTRESCYDITVDGKHLDNLCHLAAGLLARLQSEGRDGGLWAPEDAPIGLWVIFDHKEWMIDDLRFLNAIE